MRNVKSCSQNPSRGFNGERLSTVAPFRSDTYSYETHVFCSLPQRRGHGRTQRSAGIAAGAVSPHTRGGPGLLSRRGGIQHFEVGFASSPPSARRAKRSTPRCRNEVRHHLSHPNSTFLKGAYARDGAGPGGKRKEREGMGGDREEGHRFRRVHVAAAGERVMERLAGLARGDG